MQKSDSGKIIIAHADKGLRSFISERLEKYNFEIFQTETGKLVLELSEFISPCFIVTGHTLSDMSAPEMIKTLQAGNYNIPFLLIADSNNIENSLEMMKLGAVDYIFRKDLDSFFSSGLVGKIFDKKNVSDKYKVSEIQKKRVLKSEEKYRCVFEDNPLVKMVIDLGSGSIIDANGSASDFYGWTRKQIRKMNINEIDLLFEEKIKLKKDIKNFSFESVHKKSDGSFADVEVISNTLRIEDKNLLYYIVLDLTEKKKKDNRLNLLSISLDHSPVLVVITDSLGRIEYVNHEFTKVTGYCFDEVKGKNPSILKSGRHNKAFYKELWDTVLQGRTWVGEFCNKKKNNEIYWEKAIISPVKNHRKEITNFVAIKEDITEKRNIVKELIIAKDEAQAANKAKSEFLATMSHELRTPLNGVIGFSEILKDTPLEDDQKEYVNTISTSAKLLLNIINDILDFSKLEAGKLELEKVKTDIRRLVYQSIDNIRFSAEEKGLEILLDIDAQVPKYFYVDPVRLKQILSNLLGNAVKFTGKGEVELSVSFRKISDFNGEFLFKVRDTGIGIEEKHKDKIFKAFSQADSSTTRRFGGTGLGLIICDMLAKEMKTEIKFESEPGRGSLFYFTIEADTEGFIKYSGFSDKIKKALVIDENKKCQAILKKIFADMNIEAYPCLNKEDFLKFTGDNKRNYDIFIIDYKSAFMPSEELIKELRHKFSSDSLFILSHSTTDTKDIKKFHEKNSVDSAIVKPLTHDSLFDCISGAASDLEGFSFEEEVQLIEIISDISTEPEKLWKVLIAEDNNLNMLLAKTLVSKVLPFSLIFEAENGKKAVEAYFDHEPDIIFMDLQMPVMGGNEAVSIIREAEKKLERHTPVIGLTAVAFEDQLEISRKKGMDEFIVKPIEIDKFKYVLKSFLKTDENNNCCFEEYVHFNYHEFLKIVDDYGAVNEIIKAVKKDLSHKIQAVKNEISLRDYLGLFEIFSSLKQTSIDMKFNRLAELTAEAESAAKKRNCLSIERILDDIIDECKVIICLLERIPFKTIAQAGD
ncbi:MAG: response regulator [Desulfobacteraceae bacterium]|nr:response regulator [Desulfobacteraceae bacterium]